MKFKINHEPSLDSLIISGNTIEECQKATSVEAKKRGWNRIDCWSEEVK